MNAMNLCTIRHDKIMHVINLDHVARVTFQMEPNPYMDEPDAPATVVGGATIFFAPMGGEYTATMDLNKEEAGRLFVKVYWAERGDK